MSILEEDADPSGGLIITLVGEPGTGKTSTALTFPEPYLIRTQGENVPRDFEGDVPARKVTASVNSLWEKIKALIEEDHDYKTLVIDSITGLEQLFIQDILKSDPKAKGINQALGGYGAGPNAVSALHARVRRGAEALKDKKGMNTVFIAHADIANIEPPDTQGYTQYSLQLSKKSMYHYVGSVDAVAFLKQETIVVGDEGEAKKAKGTSDIIMTCTLNPAYVTKNRLGIKEDITVVKGQNPFSKYL